MPARTDDMIPIEALIGERDPNGSVDPEYKAWELAQHRDE